MPVQKKVWKLIEYIYIPGKLGVNLSIEKYTNMKKHKVFRG